MSLDDLEIFIITYNRCALLKKTLGVLLSEQSPVKNCSIICLDNNSDDDTERTVKKFDVPNLKYIKNNRNVGLMGNFAKCVEFCSKKYMWVLSDNDDIDFSAFNEVEKFMSNEVVLINVSSVIPKNNSKIETILAQSVFLPAMIYSTKYINDTVMSHIMCNIYTVFAQCTLCALIYNQATESERQKIGITSKNIVNFVHNVKIENIDEYNVDRVIANEKLPMPINFRSNNQHVNVVYAFSVLNDKCLYQKLMKFLCNRYLDFRYIAKKMCLSSPFASDKRLFRWFLSTLNFRLKVKMMKCFLSQKLKNLIRKGK